MVGMRQIRAEAALRNDELTMNNEIEFVNYWEPLGLPQFTNEEFIESSVY